MNESFINRVGIVDVVKAVRSKSEVVNLAVTVRFGTTLSDGNSWSTDPQTDVVTFSLPPGEGVNPGDVVVLNLAFKAPFGQRFAPSLSVGEPDEVDEDGEDAPTYTDD